METEKVDTVLQRKYLRFLVQFHTHRSKKHPYVSQALFQVHFVVVNEVKVIHIPTVILDAQLLFNEMV